MNQGIILDRILKGGASNWPAKNKPNCGSKSKFYTYSVWLDFIRGTAASIVFLGHARVLFIGSLLSAAGFAGAAGAGAGRGGANQTTRASAEFTDPGHIAVIVFFVLSGYLVGGGVVRALRSGQWSLKHYTIQRLSRLWTVLIPALLIGATLDRYGLMHFGHSTIYGAPITQRIVYPDLTSRLSARVFFCNILFLQGINGEKLMGTNSPLWTLSYEFWFYAAFPFLAFALWPTTNFNHRLAAVFALILIGAFVGPKISLYFLVWLMGAAVEIIPKKLNARTAAICATFGSLAFIALCIQLLRIRFNIIFSDAIEAMAFSILCFLIVHLKQEMKSSIFSRASSGLSAMSYTLYLVHTPMLVFLAAILFPVWRPWSITPLGLIKFGAVCGVVFGYAAILWWAFERNTPKIRAVLTGATKWIV